VDESAIVALLTLALREEHAVNSLRIRVVLGLRLRCMLVIIGLHELLALELESLLALTLHVDVRAGAVDLVITFN